MRASDYERLLDAMLQAGTQVTEASTARLLQIIDWLDRRRSRRKPQFIL